MAVSEPLIPSVSMITDSARHGSERVVEAFKWQNLSIILRIVRHRATVKSPYAKSLLQIQVPDECSQALEVYATETQFPIELVIEMALAQFLDVDAVTFKDCDPVMSPGRLREELETLKRERS